MRRSLRATTSVAALVLFFSSVRGAGAQDQTVVNPSGQRIVVAGQEVKAAPAVDTRKLNDRQKALAAEADKLLEMATDLKSQVSVTNKNILSIKVVQKADEIEQYAQRMKDEARKKS